MVKKTVVERDGVVAADPNLNRHPQASEPGDTAGADLLRDLHSMDFHPKVDQEGHVSAVAATKVEHPLAVVPHQGRYQARIATKEGANDKLHGVDILRITRSVERVVRLGQI